MSRPMRSTGAILAGFFAVVIVTTVTDIALHAAGVFPPMGQPVASPPLVLATAYRVIFQIGGSYLTARLAPDHPMRLALIGGAIGMAIAIAGAVLTWNGRTEFGPHWYPVALVILAMPTAWAGGELYLASGATP